MWENVPRNDENIATKRGRIVAGEEWLERVEDGNFAGELKRSKKMRTKYSWTWLILVMCMIVSCEDEAVEDRKVVTGLSETDFVHLGLSVCWASKNYNSASPSEAGSYCQFGDTVREEGVVGISVSSATEKVVQESVVKRVPTQAEWEELIKKCNWEWAELNGVKGYKVTSKVDSCMSQSIFLPAVGCVHKGGNAVFNVAVSGCYWSSTESPIQKEKCGRQFYFDEDSYYVGLGFGVSNGCSLRLVCEKKAE